MKTKLIVLFLIFSTTIFAQTSTITVFSQEGERFYVILNGIRQNDSPATNVKVVNLEKPNYLLKIVFEDQNIATINQNVYLLDYDEKRTNVTYNLKKDKKGKMKLTMNSFDYDENQTKATEVVKYHETENPIVKPQKNDSKTETTTVGINTMGIGMNTTVEESNDNMNVNINIGGLNTSVTATSTTTTSTSIKTAPTKIIKEENTPEKVLPTSNANSPKGCSVKMVTADFQKAKASIQKESFADSKLKIAKQIAKVNCFSTDQIIEILDLFSFEENKLDYAKFAYNRCTDKDNYYQVNDAFTFSASKDELIEYIDEISK